MRRRNSSSCSCRRESEVRIGRCETGMLKVAVGKRRLFDFRIEECDERDAGILGRSSECSAEAVLECLSCDQKRSEASESEGERNC